MLPLWFVLCVALCYFILVFFNPFSLAITSLGEERASLGSFRTFVWFALVWFCLFPLPLGVWEGLRFVIVALPGLFSYLFFFFLILNKIFFVLFTKGNLVYLIQHNDFHTPRRVHLHLRFSQLDTLYIHICYIIINYIFWSIFSFIWHRAYFFCYYSNIYIVYWSILIIISVIDWFLSRRCQDSSPLIATRIINKRALIRSPECHFL